MHNQPQQNTISMDMQFQQHRKFKTSYYQKLPIHIKALAGLSQAMTQIQRGMFSNSNMD